MEKLNNEAVLNEESALIFILDDNIKEALIVEDDYKAIRYESIPDIIAEHFGIVQNFRERFVGFVNRLSNEKALSEFTVDYATKDGATKRINYHITRQAAGEYLMVLSVDNSEISVDELTKSNNKDYIENKVKSAIAAKIQFALALIDVDDFKNFNETYGNALGDIILIQLVAACKKTLGRNGYIARIGGDTFLLFSKVEDDYDKVHELLFELKQNVQKITSAAIQGSSITVTLGSAQYPSDGANFDTLFKKANRALTRGKNKGSDCFVMYSEDKCGPITKDDSIIADVKKIDKRNAKNNVYSVITTVNSLLSTDSNFDDAISDSLNLIGNYFYIDRISISRTSLRFKKVEKRHEWFNSSIIKKYPSYSHDNIIQTWQNVFAEKHYIQISDVGILDESHPLKSILSLDHTYSSLAFELIINENNYGIIRFDMTTGKRNWTPEEFQMFMLIANLFATYIQKNYVREQYFKDLYFDGKYNCYNFAKFFADSADYLVNNKMPKYTIMEIAITNFIKNQLVLGEKKMADIIKIIIDVLAKADDIIYGKKAEESFVVLFKHQDKEIIDILVNSIRNEIEDKSHIGDTHLVNIKFGACFADASSDSLTSAIDNAALTRHVNKGKEILYYSDEIKEKSLFNSEMIMRIDEAIENNEFLLYLQPKISTHTGKLAGAEALTRWNYKHEKLLFPDSFIPLLERHGLIAKLDYSVFINVCRFQRKLLDENKNTFPISVNVSRYVTDFKEYIETIEEIRNLYNVPARLIEIEITEGMYYENSEKISSFINDLHDIGYKVSMDDFGSGYSNFVSLVELKFDIIKLDRSFCTSLSTDKAKLMVHKVIDLMKSLEMQTVCEGVETKENVDYLTAIGCDLIQGYYYDKPIPQLDFEKKYL